MKKINVILADKNKLFAEIVRAILEEDGNFRIVAIAESGREVIDLLGNIRTDIIILDYGMPGLSGLRLVEILASWHPEIKTLLMSNKSDKETIDKIVQSGVTGFMLKRNAHGQQLLKAVYELHEKGSYYGSSYQKLIVENYLPPITGRDTKNMELTKRETEILRLIFDGFTSMQIAEMLQISSGTVNTHRKRLLEKLNCGNTAQLIRAGLEKGIIKIDV